MLSYYWRKQNLTFLNCNVLQFQKLTNITADGIYRKFYRFNFSKLY